MIRQHQQQVVNSMGEKQERQQERNLALLLLEDEDEDHPNHDRHDEAKRVTLSIDHDYDESIKNNNNKGSLLPASQQQEQIIQQDNEELEYKKMMKNMILKVKAELRSLRQSSLIALKESQHTYESLVITSTKQKQEIESMNEKVTTAKSKVSMLKKELREVRRQDKVKRKKTEDSTCSVFNRKCYITFPNFLLPDRGVSKRRIRGKQVENRFRGGQVRKKSIKEERRRTLDRMDDEHYTDTLDISAHTCPPILFKSSSVDKRNKKSTNSESSPRVADISTSKADRVVTFTTIQEETTSNISLDVSNHTCPPSIKGDFNRTRIPSVSIPEHRAVTFSTPDNSVLSSNDDTLSRFHQNDENSCYTIDVSNHTCPSRIINCDGSKLTTISNCDLAIVTATNTISMSSVPSISSIPEIHDQDKILSTFNNSLHSLNSSLLSSDDIISCSSSDGSFRNADCNPNIIPGSIMTNLASQQQEQLLERRTVVHPANVSTTPADHDDTAVLLAPSQEETTILHGNTVQVDSCFSRDSDGDSKPSLVSPNHHHEEELLVDFCTGKERRRRRYNIRVQELESSIAVKHCTIVELERHLIKLLNNTADRRKTL